MQDLIAQVLVLLRGAWRYRWAAIGVAWAVAVAGWIAVQFIPDKYTSSTKVYVDTESLLRPLLSGLAINRDVMSQVAMMQAVMLSRPNLEKVAQKTDLMLDATTPAEQQAVVDSLARRIKLGRTTAPGQRTSLNTFEVSFDDNDPKIANRVVQELLDTFMEDSLGLKRNDTTAAQRFLESQSGEYERALEEAEDRLARFKQENAGAMPDTAGGYYSRLETEVNAMQQLRQAYAQMQTRRDELARQLAGEEPTYGLMGSGDGKPIDGQIARFKAQRDQLLLQYTDKHPQVQSLNEAIAGLEEEKRSGAKISNSVAAPGGGMSNDEAVVRSLDMNPVYQNLRLALSQADADLAAIRGHMQGQQAAINDLQARVSAVPTVEAELGRLNRDFDIAKRNYDSLVQRLESARISQSVEQSDDSIKFRVIEPPVVPFTPSGPERAALNTLVLLAALGASLGLAVLLAQARPTFTTRDILQKIAGIPVLGTITVAVRSAAVPWYRRQPVLVGAAVSLLVVAFVLNLVLTEPLRAALRAVVG